MKKEHITLKNGLQVWMDFMPDMHSAAFGIWISAGSVWEAPEENGISHFLEHMFFKDSKNRTAKQIASEMDAIGGVMNAYTSKEYTCFYARTLREHISEGFAILADMLTQPALRHHDLKTERSVVLEELHMAIDDPEDLVFEQLTQNVWKTSPYGQPILGTEENIAALSCEKLRDYFGRHYSPDRTVICISGNFDRDEFLAQVTRFFAHRRRSAAPRLPYPPAEFRRCAVLTPREELEQTHLSLGLPALPITDSRRHALSVLTMALGSSGSSRLFQRIREELGLVYTVSAEALPYSTTGLLEIYAAVSPHEACHAVEEICAVLNETRKGLTQEEFARCREGLKSSLLMSLESNMTRVSVLGRNALYGLSPEDGAQIENLRRVSLDDVNALAAELLDPNRLSVSAVGPIADSRALRAFAGSR